MDLATILLLTLFQEANGVPNTFFVEFKFAHFAHEMQKDAL